MKRVILAITGICLLLGLFGCAKQAAPSQSNETSASIEINVVNQIAESDIWVIADTEKNRSTTVWGTPTAAKSKACDEAISVTVPESGTYLVRMIDNAGMFYSADGIELTAQQTLVLKGDAAAMTAVAEVYAQDGSLLAQYDMFVGRL